MNQAKVNNLVSRLNYKVQDKRRLKSFDGPEGRVRKIQKTLTALLKYERIELYYNRADEVRGYADRLISEAIRHGPTHAETMEMADYWILEKQYVHKLFKVLVPRYSEYSGTSFTKLHRLPKVWPDATYWNSVLELKDNPFPRLDQMNPFQSKLIHNVLLDEARKEFRINKYKEFADNLTN
ncbi:GSCOCG00007700001-RA-CDS [Cotesia congregata]|uniref:Large ribosomal subunit protein bL17m n=1 Tax=Cotesia congregata TaxID=51543 RepID=A0A8J2HIN5_COTCN|nr:GSCOCG00007700001-RA-CDS [Cotesia congregata]CAG5099438.1 Similar to MRPL17: 39S ribosomal protein L17 [Cotesia congregata]